MKKTNSNSMSSQAFKSLPVGHSVFKALVKPAIPLVALLSSPLVYATCQYEVQDDWNSGFRTEITITNDSSAPIVDWEVSWNFSDGSSLQNGWNAEYNCNGSSCTASGPSWARDISPNQSFTLGFIGQKATLNAPAVTSIVVSGEACGVASAPAPVPVTPVAPTPPTPETPPVAPAPVEPTPVVPVAPAPVEPTPVVPVAPAPVEPTPVVPVAPVPVEPTPVVPVDPTNASLVTWTLDGSESNIQYVSTRRDHDGEVNEFKQGTDGADSLNGSIDRLGNAVLSIDLNDVQTGVDIRNERMLNFVFETELLPTAYITIGVDSDALSEMAVGTSLVQDISGEITLHAIRQDIEAEVIIAKTSATNIVVSTTQPILIDSKDFEFASGVEILRGLANLPSIAETVPVYFRLSYEANTNVNAQPLTLASQPLAASDLNVDYRQPVNAQLDWADNSQNETAFILRRRLDSGLWGTVGDVSRDVTTFNDEFSEFGDYDYKVIAVNRGIPSESSNIERITAIDPNPPVVPVDPVAPVDPVVPVDSGAQIYADQCLICHGPTGEGVGSFPAIEPRGDLAVYIQRFMPLGNPAACGQECSETVASYIEENFFDAVVPVVPVVPVEPTPVVPVAPAPVEPTPVVPVAPAPVEPTPVVPVAPTPVEPTPVEPTPIVPVAPTPVADVALGEELYVEQCLICHGDSGQGVATFPAINVETDVEILSAYIAEFMPLGNPARCDQECADNITAYIEEVFWADGGGVVDNTPVASACVDNDAIHYGARQLKILTRSEYQNSVVDLIGIDFNAAEGLSEDSRVGLFANNTQASIVASSYSNYLLVAEEIADWSAERDFAPALNCNQIDQNCANNLLNDLAPRIFRRALETDEVETYTAMANGSLTNGNIREGITLALETMLSSPTFLYRHELGEANPANPDLDSDGFELTSYEMATFLAYTFTGSTPDRELLQAARNDALRDDAEIQRQAMRLFAGDRSRDVMGDFVASWLGTENLPIVGKNQSLFPGFDSIVPHMQNEIRENFASVMLDNNESFASLYDADFSYLNQQLAEYYGIAGVSGDQLRRVATSDRGGILANGAFMARWGESVESSPILRGVRVRRRMLCQDELPDPPAGTFASREARLAALEEILQDPTTTNRHETELLTEGQPCAACHLEYINPIGFGLEDFDTVGRVRSSDLNGNVINSAGQLFAPIDFNNTNQVENFEGAKGLGSLLSTLPTAQSCVSEQMFRYIIGVGHENIDPSNPDGATLEDDEVAGYACEVDSLTESLMDASPREMLERFSTLDAVRYRKAWARESN